MLIIIGILSGIISGMGIGGGAVLIPLVTMFCSLDQKTAQAVNLIYFIPTAIAAVIMHFKKGNIDKDDVKFILPIVFFGIAGAVCGCMLARSFDNGMLRKIFAVFLFIMGIAEIIKGIRKKRSAKG